ncbi:MAG: hypothetical protein GY906_22840 [bacterium]|nr:hypothetical protein [bacterium]
MNKLKPEHWALLAVAGIGVSYYAWKRGRVRLIAPNGEAILTNGQTIPVHHTGTIDVPVSALVAVMGTAIKKVSPFS